MGPFGRQRACALRIWLIRRFIDMKWIDVNSDDSLQLLSLSLCHALSSGFHVGRSKNSSLGKWIESGLHWILDCYLRERSCASTGGLSCNEPPLSAGARTHSKRNSFFVPELRVMWADMLNIAQYCTIIPGSWESMWMALNLERRASWGAFWLWLSVHCSRYLQVLASCVEMRKRQISRKISEMPAIHLQPTEQPRGKTSMAREAFSESMRQSAPKSLKAKASKIYIAHLEI